MPDFTIARNRYQGERHTQQELAQIEYKANLRAADLLRQLEAAREEERLAKEAQVCTVLGIWPGEEFIVEKVGANGRPDPSQERRAMLIRHNGYNATVRYINANKTVGAKEYTLYNLQRIRRADAKPTSAHE